VAVVSKDLGHYKQGKRVVSDGSPLWIVSPHFQSVEVHRSNLPPVLYTGTTELTVEPDLPGLKFNVNDIFES
jgi:Uma2 family endonuclease